MKMRLKMKKRSQRYDINRPRPRHVDTDKVSIVSQYTLMMVICIKQDLSNV